MSRHLCMVLFLQLHFIYGKWSFQVFLMLGIRHKCIDLCLSLVARSSRIYCDVSVLIVSKYFASSSAQVDILIFWYFFRNYGIFLIFQCIFQRSAPDEQIFTSYNCLKLLLEKAWYYITSKGGNMHLDFRNNLLKCTRNKRRH